MDGGAGRLLIVVIVELFVFSEVVVADMGLCLAVLTTGSSDDGMGGGSMAVSCEILDFRELPAERTRILLLL